MHKVAKVFVNIPIKSIVKPYSYTIPAELSFITLGWRVLVSFGNRKVEGFIYDIIEQEDITELKSILAVVDQEPWFNGNMIKLAKWMSDYYLCSISETMRLFMPGKSGLRISSIYKTMAGEVNNHYLDTTYKEIYTYILKNQPVTDKKISKIFSTFNTNKILKYLINNKFIYKDNEIQKKFIEKREKFVELNCAIHDYEKIFILLKNKPSQLKLFKFLIQNNTCSIKNLKINKFSHSTIKALADANLIKFDYRQILRNSYDSYEQVQQHIVLTPEQQSAVQSIFEYIELERQRVFLLHGITGSGKTQIYIESVMKIRKNGKTAIILVPEIALTSQIVQRFKEIFDDDVIVIHSNLSINERNDAIKKLKNGDAGIVIGARSAIFSPIDNLGIIILDEEHDYSYKQDESPRYHTRDVAIELSKIHQAVLLLGSATPSIESYHLALTNQYQLLQLKKRIENSELPIVKAIDMREELRLGRKNVISNELKALIVQTITKKEQLIILLNRRGFSTFVLCRECGHVIACKNCTLPMVYHKNGKLQCHFCDSTENVPDTCPKCGSRYIKYFGTGTERLEYELNKLFPEVRIARMDRDTMTKKMAHSKLLHDFSNNKYDILLGTQMVAKGHDVKNVTGVGIISADASLNLPDFRAAEKCFSLITQAAGRAGRGNLSGRVIVQTYNPEHYAVLAAIQHDYLAFFEQEIMLRKQLFYPPYSKLIKLIVQSKNEKSALEQATLIVKNLMRDTPNADDQILGPFPPTIAKLKDFYRFNIFIKTTHEEVIKKFLIKYDIHIQDNIIIDVNPVNVM